MGDFNTLRFPFFQKKAAALNLVFQNRRFLAHGLSVAKTTVFLMALASFMLQNYKKFFREFLTRTLEGLSSLSGSNEGGECA